MRDYQIFKPLFLSRTQVLTKQGVENPKVTNGITLCSTTPHIHFMQMIHFMQIIHAA